MNSGSDSDSRYWYWQELEFAVDDPNDTNLIDDTDAIVFSVSTLGKGANAVTTYAGESGTPIATLERRRVLGDRLTFAEGGEKTTPGKWLKHSKGWEPGQLDVMHYVSFENKGNKYTWKGYANKGALQLYLDGVGLIAKNEISRKPRREGDSRARPAVLLLSDIAQADRDTVILSFLLVERERRKRGGTSKIGDASVTMDGYASLQGIGMTTY